MRKIAIINQKGGVGKTTTTANLGAALARAGKRVLLVDLDPQAHLTLHFGITLADDQTHVYDVLTSSAPVTEALMRLNDTISLVPTNVDLAGAEMELVSIPGREVILREALAPIENEFDLMLIDCPPALGVLTINALVAADEIIIPLQAHFFALQGLGKLLDTVRLVRQRINPNLSVAGVILCMHEAATKLAGEVVDDLKRFLDSSRGAPVPWAGARIYENTIRRNIKLAESSSYGQTVFDYAPRSNGAIDYARLTAEIFDMNVDDILQSQEAEAMPGAGATDPPRQVTHGDTLVASPADLEPPSANVPFPPNYEMEAAGRSFNAVAQAG